MIPPNLAKAIVLAQGQIEGAKKGKKNDHFKSKYADLASVWDACRDALQANNLAVVQLPCEAPAGYVGLVTTVLHSCGESLSEKYFMPLKDPTNPQAAGSALTYARRYALAAVIGICPEDDDGNAAAVPVKAAATGQAAVNHESPLQYIYTYNNAKTTSEKKVAYSQLKNSSVPDSKKREILTAWASEIKAMEGNK